MPAQPGEPAMSVTAKCPTCKNPQKADYNAKLTCPPSGEEYTAPGQPPPPLPPPAPPPPAPIPVPVLKPTRAPNPEFDFDAPAPAPATDARPYGAPQPREPREPKPPKE